jgi:hypothetical protein
MICKLHLPYTQISWTVDANSVITENVAKTVASSRMWNWECNLSYSKSNSVFEGFDVHYWQTLELLIDST